MEKIVKNIIEEQNDENIAITSVESPPLSYRDLKILINNISRQLSANGISNKDRRFKSVKANRGNDGKGTKREGFSTKTMKKTSKSRNKSTRYKK